MKKTFTLLGIAGVLGAGFYMTSGGAESPTASAEKAPIQTQAEVGEKETVIKESNRLEGALLIAEAMGINPIEATVYYEDVPEEHQGIINALVSNNIVGSITMDFFGADEPMTRGETALWISHAFELKQAETSQYAFTDVNELCAQDIADVVSNGIMEPATDSSFDMGGTVTLDMLTSYLDAAANRK